MPYSKKAVVLLPLGLTVPFSVAVAHVTPETDSVVTLAGQADVVKVRFEPRLVPLAFVATARKWYVVPQDKSAMEAPWAKVAVPEPRSCEDVLWP
jgi:hypothetical protein